MRFYNPAAPRRKFGINIFIYSGVIAAGVVLPYLTHVFGGITAGRTLLPLHFVILSAGFFFGWEIGLAAGVTLPFISFLLTGMPPLPILPQMIIEIGLYGFVSGFFYRTLKWNLFISLLLSLLAGRLFLLLFYGLFKGNLVLFWLQLRTGVLGIFLQLILLPLVITLVEKNTQI